MATEEKQPQTSALAVADSNETAWRIAQSAPRRDLSEIWKEVKQELEFAPEYAEEAWYSIPYKDKSGKITPVEGISIHGATALIRAWGHNACGGGIREDHGDKVICRGVFYDHMNNVQFYKEVSVSRYQQTKGGGTYRLMGKHWDNAVQSGISKAMRNAGLHGMPEYMKEKFFKLAKQLSMMDKKGAPVQTTAQKLMKAEEGFVKRFKITAEVYEKYVDALQVGGPEELLVHLKGLYSGLTSGEITVDSVFGEKPEEKKVMTPPEEKTEEPIAF